MWVMQTLILWNDIWLWLDKHGEQISSVNAERIVANGAPLYYVPLLFEIDDMSGNRSKKWNIHYAANFVNATLNHKIMQAERSINLLAISQHAQPLEIMEALTDQIKFVFFHLMTSA
jgi:hypothetical protein